MQRNTPSRNIAARAGRWSAQNRKKAIFGWLALVLIAVFAGQAVGTNEPSQNAGPGESGSAGAAIDRAFPKNDGATEQVLVQKKGNVSDAAFRSTAVTPASCRPTVARRSWSSRSAARRTS